MSMRGIMWGVLAQSETQFLDWVNQIGEAAQQQPLPDCFTLQRCKRIMTMLDVYQAQNGDVEIIQLPDWSDAWNPGEIFEIVRRLEL